MVRLFTIIGVLASLLGLLFLGITVVLALRKYSKVKSWTKTTGVVVNVHASAGMSQSQFDGASTRNTLHKPTVRFQTADGRIVDYTPNTSNSWSNYTVGQNLEIYYDPRQPANASVGAGVSLYFGFMILGFVGAAFFLVGTFFAVIFANVK